MEFNYDIDESSYQKWIHWNYYNDSIKIENIYLQEQIDKKLTRSAQLYVAYCVHDKLSGLESAQQKTFGSKKLHWKDALR
jgi:hypothetical protein